MLAFSLVGWVVLCAWAWILLGGSDTVVSDVAVTDLAIPEMAVVESTELPSIEAVPEFDENSSVVEVVPAPLSAPEVIIDAPLVGDRSTSAPIQQETESVEAVSRPESNEADESVVDSFNAPLPESSDLLEGFPDPEGLGEVESDGAEATRLATEPLETTETTYEQQRREELSVLAGLSSRLKFEPSSAERTPRVQTVLDRIFDPLFLYADMGVEVTVNSNDLASPADNRQLSRLRGRVIVDYLAQRGLDTSRFVVVSEGGRGLAIGAHRVQVISEVLP